MRHFLQYAIKHNLFFEVKFTIFKFKDNLFKRHISTVKSINDIKMSLPKRRENPVVTKLDSEEFKSIFTPELKTLVELFKNNNYEIRIAGGAVRDLLMGQIPKDIDFATTATPDQMKRMFENEKIRMINENGEKHGTITPRINDTENFEVTTLRIDVITDGRHAEIEYTTDWMLDANRRDLTINSMFLDLDGTLYDYFYGYDDIQNRKITFVGDAGSRIKEDYLRILRYFRFYGKIAEHADNHDEETLRVISQNVDGLKRISGERIWMELKKILGGRFAGELLKTMIHVGISKYCGFPERVNLEELNKVWDRSKHLNLQAMTLLCSLLNNCDEVFQLNERVKLSAYDRELGLFVVQHREPKLHEKSLLPYKKIVIGSIKGRFLVKEYIIEVLKYNNSPYLEEFEQWMIPKFPLPATLINERFGVPKGRAMGFVINELKRFWAEHDFTTDIEELLREVPAIKCKLEEKKIK